MYTVVYTAKYMLIGTRCAYINNTKLVYICICTKLQYINYLIYIYERVKHGESCP